MVTRGFGVGILRTMTAVELVEQIRSGEDDVSAQEELHRRVHQVLLERVRGKIPPRLKSRLDAEDVVQMAFLRAVDALDTFRGTTDPSFFAWVYTIAKHLMYDIAERRSAAARPFAREEYEGGPRESQVPGGEPRVSSQMARREWIDSMLGDLKEKEAEVIRLRRLQGMSFEKIAEKWRKTPEAVRRFYSRAFERLKDLAQRRKE